MEFKKKDTLIEVFTGTTYELPKLETIGELRSWLEWIVKDLPEGDERRIVEVSLRHDELDYTLEEGIY